MHQGMSHLLDQLLDAPAADKRLKPDKQGLLELARLAQTVTDQHFLLLATAKRMAASVEAVFGSLSLIFVLTEPGRRQVYLAVIAKLAQDERLDSTLAEPGGRKKLLGALFLSSDEELITMAYGHCPAGFVRLLKRLGHTARRAAVYPALFKVLSEAPSLAQAPQFSGLRPVRDEFIELLAALPRLPGAARLAQCFMSLRDYRRFMASYRLLTGNADLSATHIDTICAGKPPVDVLQELYLQLSFGPPRIDLPGMRFIATGHELVQVSKDFKNCLKSYVPEAVRGERQFYVWEKPGEPAVVFSIADDKPFGWTLCEYKLAQNKPVPAQLARELISLVEFAGLRSSGYLGDVLSSFDMYHDDNELDALLQEMAA